MLSTPLPSSKDLVNIEMFLTAKEVEESLERRETATCLAWCHDNKSRLRKMKVGGGQQHCRAGLPIWHGGCGQCHQLSETPGWAPSSASRPEPMEAGES